MSDRFGFAGFELDVAGYALRRQGQRLKLEKIPMEALILMVRRAGALVTREDLEAALWASDVFVERDSAINTAVRKIRQALGDDAGTPRFVETVVGKGYRFVAPVECAGAEPRASGLSNYCVTRGRKEFVLGSGENLLGRDPDARVCLDHPSVSRRHARISVGRDRITLEDLESRNGTFVDGRKIDAAIDIDPGAIIALGRITVTFLARSGPASTRPIGAVSRRGTAVRT